MDAKVKAIHTLYKAKRISLTKVRDAVKNNIITKDQYTEITGEKY